jgi:hypothetical protein
MYPTYCKRADESANADTTAKGKRDNIIGAGYEVVSLPPVRHGPR